MRHFRAMTRTIDLNADLGEGCGDDEGLMEVISSANIACGGHAGDEMSMRTALRLAKQHGVAAGAHPSYPDKEHFGRRSMAVEPEALLESLSMQIANLAGFAAEEGVTIHHVKPHGALYNDAVRDPALAAVVLAASGISTEAAGTGCQADQRMLDVAVGAFHAQTGQDVVPASGTDHDRFERALVEGEFLRDVSSMHDLDANGVVTPEATSSC